MIDAKGPFRTGALFVGLSGILHILAPLVSSFASGALILVPAGLFYLVLAYGLLQGWRWLAYLVFLILMIGSVIAIGSAWSTPMVPTWVFLTIFVLDWLAILALFAALWRSRPAVA